MPHDTRIGDWIQTTTGKQFWVEDPRPEDVCIEDIAHALSQICRFTGHCTRFYSVAEHSLFVMAHVPVKFQPWALLHDAAEAYVSDIAAPLKRSEKMADYRAIEQRVLEAILRRFELQGDAGFWMPPAVKEADLRALMTERRDLMMPSSHEWSVPAEPYINQLPNYASADIEDKFLKAAHRMGLA